jgi:hypothetical protein
MPFTTPNGILEDRGNEHLWCSTNNGTETHTSAIDEFVIGQLQAKDFIDAFERMDKSMPLPSVGWLGSLQLAIFLCHNSALSTFLGCGALDLVHPMGGQMYQATKALLLARVYEGRCGISHFIRVVRAVFVASFLRDNGVSQQKLPEDEMSESQECSTRVCEAASCRLSSGHRLVRFFEKARGEWSEKLPLPIFHRNQWLIQLDNSTSIVRRLQYSSLLLMLRCRVNRCLKCILPLEAKIVKPCYALFRQLPRAILLDLF